MKFEQIDIARGGYALVYPKSGPKTLGSTAIHKGYNAKAGSCRIREQVGDEGARMEVLHV